LSILSTQFNCGFYKILRTKRDKINKILYDVLKNTDSLLWRNQRIGLCKNSLKIPPDDGRITAEMRIGSSL
jgi:hypothetical protein